MGYGKWRTESIRELAVAGFSAEETTILLSAATSIQRIGEALCSFDMGARETKRVEKREENAHKRVLAIAAAHGYRDTASGDPRGCAVVFTKEGKRTLYIPGRPFPSSVYNR